MRILVVQGSPRPCGNTARLSGLVLDGARTVGAEVSIETYHLNDLDFRGCQGCMECKAPEAAGCVLRDDLTPLLGALVAADALVMATPIYMGQVSGQMKLFWDRTYGYMLRGGGNRLPGGKRAVAAVTQGMRDTRHYQAVVDQVVRSFTRRGMEVRAVVVGGTDGRATGDIEFGPEAAGRARRLGQWLVGIEPA